MLAEIAAQPKISNDEANDLFTDFATGFCNKRDGVNTEMVIEAIQTICNEALTSAQKSARSCAYEIKVPTLAVGDSTMILFRDYEEIVRDTLAARWQLEMVRDIEPGQRMQDARIAIEEALFPMRTGIFSSNRPYCYDYLLKWNPDNLNVNPPTEFEAPMSAEELLQASIGSLDELAALSATTTIQFTDKDGLAKDYVVNTARIIEIPLFRSLFSVEGFKESADKKKIGMKYDCEQKHFEWMLNYIQTTRLYEASKAPETAPTFTDYTFLAHLGSYLQAPEVVLMACRNLKELVNDDSVFTIASYMTDLYQDMPHPLPGAADGGAGSEPPEIKIAHHLATLLEHCRRHLYLNPSRWQDLDWPSLESQTLTMLYNASLGLKHSPLQLRCHEEIQRRIENEEASAPKMFVLLTRFLEVENSPHVKDLFVQCAKKLELPCTSELVAKMRTIWATPIDLPDGITLPEALAIFRLALAGNANFQERLATHLKAQLSADNWLVMAAHITDPKIAAFEPHGRALWEHTKTYLTEHPELLEAPIPVDATVETLAQYIWIGEVFDKSHLVEKPASDRLIDHLNHAPTPENFSIVFEIFKISGGDGLLKVLSRLVTGDEGAALKESDNDLYSEICRVLDIHDDPVDDVDDKVGAGSSSDE